MEIDSAISLTYRELMDATQNFGAFNTPHEGYAVILEELDELWDAIKIKQGGKDEKGRTRIEAIREESIQVAAMALRMLVDCCPKSLPSAEPSSIRSE